VQRHWAARIKVQKCGTFGDISILSFNGNKIITTSGGGAIVTKNLIQKDKAVFLSTQARDNAPHYQHSEIGYNYRMSNICAGIGRGQMEVLDKHILLRREMNAFYKEIFKDNNCISVLSEPNENYYSNHWLTAITINKDSNISSENLRLQLEKENIESRPLWKPMHLQPVFKEAPYYGGTVSETLFKDGLCLPSGSNLTENEKERIKICLKNN
jgi:dTDP-4-amino-4,6-dideoxygalactose transaminase